MEKYYKDLIGDQALVGGYQKYVRDKYLSPLLRSRPDWSLTTLQKEQLTFVGTVLQRNAGNNFSKKKYRDFMEETNHSISIIDGECGLGKTSMLTQFLSNLDSVMKGVVFVQQTDTAKKLEKSMGSKSIAIISDGKSDGTILERLLKSLENNEHQVYILTHAFLKQVLKNKMADVIWNNFESITVDETFDSYTTYNFSYHTINGKIKPLLEQYRRFPEVKIALEFINNILDKMEELVSRPNEIFTRAKYNDFDSSIFQKALEVITNPDNRPSLGYAPKKDDEGMKQLIELAERDENEIDYFHFINNDVTWAFTYQYFPKKASMTILFDGGSTEPSFQALAQYSKDINVQFYKLRYKSYKHWTFYIEEDAVGKSANMLTDLQTKEAVQKLNNLTDEKLLLLTHKEIIEKFDGLNENISTLHWGQHRSTNEYADYNNIAILSWFIQPPHSYSSKFISYAGEQYVEGDYEQSNTMAKSVSLETLQGLKRVNRNSSKDEVKAYIRLPKHEQMVSSKEYVLEYLKQEFPEAKFIYQDWYSIKNNNLAQATEWAEKIIATYKQMVLDTGYQIFRLSDVVNGSGINWKTFNKSSQRRKEILVSLLAKEGIILDLVKNQDRSKVYVPAGERAKGFVIRTGFVNEA